MDHLLFLSHSYPSMSFHIVCESDPNLDPFLILSFSQLASSTAKASGNGAQAFGHTFGRLAFIDKRICASRKRGLLTGVQLANENNDQR